MGRVARIAWDDLRAFALRAAEAAGLPPPAAAHLVREVLWFESVGIAGRGLDALPDWLERLTRGEFDLRAELIIASERGALVLAEGRRGLPGAMLARAAEVAGERARDVGLALVRLRGVAADASALPALAELAIGPYLALARGPSGTWSMALPTAQGLPWLWESSPGEHPELPAAAAWAAALVESDEWLVLAAAASAWDALEDVRRRVAAELPSAPDQVGAIDPTAWAERRADLQGRGVKPSAATERRLKLFAREANLSWPRGDSGDE